MLAGLDCREAGFNKIAEFANKTKAICRLAKKACKNGSYARITICHYYWDGEAETGDRMNEWKNWEFDGKLNPEMLNDGIYFSNNENNFECPLKDFVWMFDLETLPV